MKAYLSLSGTKDFYLSVTWNPCYIFYEIIVTHFMISSTSYAVLYSTGNCFVLKLKCIRLKFMCLWLKLQYIAVLIYCLIVTGDLSKYPKLLTSWLPKQLVADEYLRANNRTMLFSGTGYIQEMNNLIWIIGDKKSSCQKIE